MRIWIKKNRRRGGNLMPRDRQQDRPTGFCPRCGRERYAGAGLCRKCRERKP